MHRRDAGDAAKCAPFKKSDVPFETSQMSKRIFILSADGEVRL
jgi:hypothetical protein